ncbi:MAG: hypothetical protein E7773_10280 [Sphingomonas sp.]|uniref:hypothetical protein n=1 Tax=Sphingomonas sp. TaxID=28214 RepID=UPI00122B401C|nr:hypothetical protein [Sphingomonas sp.]THD35725.1 MAG: hypothetical protein E7773_10280 [Sphingomonas sp.]
MTPAERNAIIQQMDILDGMLGVAHRQIQAIANREVNGALMAYPGEFSDPQLDEAKQRLIERSEKLNEAISDLHDKLVGKA